MGDEDSSVRVAVRIRPQIPREVIDMCRVCTAVTPGEPQVTLGSDKAFTYDYVFDMPVMQDEIYGTCVSSLVDGSLEGYNATVLAYGQTGSGKTYTMGTGFDVEVDPSQVGIIPRAINHLFYGIASRVEKAKEMGQPPPEFKIMAQFMELYNEEIIDLFDPAREQFTKGKTGIKIHEDAEGGIYVVGVTMKSVSSAEEALQCLRLGALSRTTASTQMNAQSSRSHAIFTLHIKQQRLVKVETDDDENPTDGGKEFETLTAKFHFVDLAGSERLKRTGATGERAREGISINCGLLALGNVISALGDKSRKVTHVPYRDSKLTRLLQDSLGGNSRTVMIACVSPSDRDFMETLNTLNYANRARNIKNRVVINQDKSSRTIVLLRQEIQQLQLELLEYKQGKRIVGEDGVESVNDMYHENIMLQSEINNLRTRVKAMQETIDALSNKNTQLLAERAVGSWVGSGETSDITEMIQGYLKEIEDLRAKLLESEAICQQLRKRQPPKMSLSPHVAMSGHFDISPGDVTSVDNLLSEAKKDLLKDIELLAKSKINDETSNDGQKNGNDDADSESDSEEKENDDASDSSSTDTEEKGEAENEEFGLKLAELTSEINIKQKLIEELELSQRRIHTMRQHYEDKMMQLQERIRVTQEERDKVLASFSNQSKEPTEKVKKVRDEYEKKLSDMQKELKRLNSAKKEHARLLQAQTQHENQLRTLKNELADMKRTKVKLLNKMKEETSRHKEAELRRNREIAQLRKASRKHENLIKSLEAEKRMKEVVLRRKQEEVSALRRIARGGLSNKAAGRVGGRNVARKLHFSPKEAKQKWQELEKTISQNAINKQTVAVIERDMERNLQERESLCHSLEDLKRRRRFEEERGNTLALMDLDEQIQNINATISYIQEVIQESQQNVMQIEDAKDIAPLMQSVNNVEEAQYIIQKLYNLTINQGYAAAQKELCLKEMEAQLKEKAQENSVQEQLLQHVLRTHGLDLDMYSSTMGNGQTTAASTDSSVPSTRSNSPTDTCNGNVRPVQTRTSKIRRKTRLPEELLYPPDAMTTSAPEVQSQDEPTEENLMPPPDKAISRVPSAPGSLKNLVTKTELPKPSPVAGRKTYDRQESTSPRTTRRTFNTLQSNLLGKPGSMDQGLDASPPNSPPTYRRTNSREENVFSRLTSGTTASSDQQIGEGVISVYQGKVNAKAPLICTHVAEGHSRAVLSVYATDDLLFSASKDRTVKIWDLQTGVERQSLRGHPNNVVSVKYHEESRLVYSVSSAYVKVWDLRDRGAKCIKTLCSSGMTADGPVGFSTPSRMLQAPVGEMPLNDVALNHCGTVLYTAASDRVRVWDLRKYEPVGKLVGGHQAAVMCLAVGKLSEDEDIVVTGSKDHYIKVFEVNRGSSNVFQPKMNLNPPHYDGIQSLAIRGDILFSGSRDMCIKKWDLSKQELIQSLNGAHKDWVCGLTFMPGGQILLSVCRAGMVKLWSADTCSLLGEMKAHGSPINAITTNSSHIFTASSDNSVRLWKLRSRYDLSPDGGDCV
ncbi:kinesin-like protein KIF21A isoform X1 [Schistocerca americana]|uniref:kinesin-like protein KIF21A isoform X1 n=1 Tax=Schistocerca americana TaxID=7009 RepID=UPI001F500712|nr:kinesin-like protein KIF21A isoform X1 [Schistocerca americana]